MGIAAPCDRRNDPGQLRARVGIGAIDANDAIAPSVATGTRVVASAIELKPSLRTARSREARLRRRPYTSPVPSQGMT